MPETDEQRPNVVITTDGSSRGNPGPGGWAALLEYAQEDDTIQEVMLTGEEPVVTTSNEMEIQAVIVGLEHLSEPSLVLVRTDSTYIERGMARITRGWIPASGPGDGARWTRLAELLTPHEVQVEWVEGHAGDERNERVNEAAKAAANRAYDQWDAQRLAESPPPAGAWTLFVRCSGGGQPVDWLLRTPAEYVDGQVEVTSTVTEPTAAWASVVAGLEAAFELGAGRQTTILVYTNLEMVVKQGMGEWRVKKHEQQVWYEQYDELAAELADVHFGWKRTPDLIALMNE